MCDVIRSNMSSKEVRIYAHIYVLHLWVKQLLQVTTCGDKRCIPQVTLVRGLAQLFLVESVFLNYQQTIYLYNFKKQNKHTLAISFC